MFVPEDPLEAIKAAIRILEPMSSDREVPRNIREIIARALEYLKNEEREPQLRASAAVDALNEITEMQNVPRHLRQRIRHVIAMLESIPPRVF